MIDSYIVVAHMPGGFFMAFEVAPGGIEGTSVFRESPSDLAQSIAALWGPMSIYVGNDAELGDDLRPHLPAGYEVRDGMPRMIQERLPCTP
jgi:hypothetical protein